MHIDFALPVDHDLRAGFEAYQRKAAKAVMDYGFHMAVTKYDTQVLSSCLARYEEFHSINWRL